MSLRSDDDHGQYFPSFGSSPAAVELMRKLRDNPQSPVLVEHFRKEAQRIGILRSVQATQLAAYYNGLADLIVELLK